MSDELYDPVANPYAPGAGTPPPALVGRDEVIDSADVALRRLRSARASQHMLITGLRGVGKTVLLGKLAALAEHVGYRVIRVEALGGDDTIRSVLRQARRIVEEFDGGAKVGHCARSSRSRSPSRAPVLRSNVRLPVPIERLWQMSLPTLLPWWPTRISG